MKRSNNLKIRFVGMITALGLLASCSEDFLHPAPSTALDASEVFQSISTAQPALVGMYDQLSSYAFEGLYLPIMSDLMGEDLLLNSVDNYNWFVPVYQLNILPNYQYNTYPWRVGYKLLFDTNLLLANVDYIPDATQDEKNELKGQALVMRAYTLLKLTEVFAPSYLEDPDAPAILLVTEPLAFDAPDVGRSSIREVYAQITRDLTDAIGLLEIQEDKGFFDQRAAQAILARAYLNMGAWEQARDMAILARLDMELMSIDDMRSGFTAPTVETIFSVAYTADDNNIYLSLPSFYYPVAGYSSMRADSVFVNRFDDMDWRKRLFMEVEEVDPDNYLIVKFMHDSKIGNAEKSSIRASEMYLIEAECEAELGNDEQAQEALHIVESRSHPGALKSTASGQELIAEILVERRKELFGEGFRWNDIKRRNLPFKREGQHWVDLDFAHGDPDYYRLTFPIPQSEIDANGMLTQDDQNAGY